MSETDQPTKRYVITNQAQGGRMILTPTGGATIFKGESRVFELTENELKMAKPYFDNGDLVYREATDEDVGVEVAMSSQNATPSSDGAEAVGGDTSTVEGGTAADEVVGEFDPDKLINVEHRGFGRYYGMSAEGPITEAMTRTEAEAFAQEHNVPIGPAPNPSAVETPQ